MQFDNKINILLDSIKSYFNSNKKNMNLIEFILENEKILEKSYSFNLIQKYETIFDNFNLEFNNFNEILNHINDASFFELRTEILEITKKISEDKEFFQGIKDLKENLEKLKKFKELSENFIFKGNYLLNYLFTISFCM